MEYQFLASIIGYNVVTVNTRYGKKKLGDEDGYEIYKSKEKIIKNKPINSTDEGKGRHRKVIRIGAFALVFVVLFLRIFFKMTDAVNIATIEGFYKEPKNTIDVMMIGASEVYADYSATEAWKNYGYTSYSLGVSGVPGSLYKSMLREALTRQHPKVVVFEVNGFLHKMTAITTGR